MESLEEAAHGMCLPPPQEWILDGGQDPTADVGIAEATEQVVAIEHGGDQADVIAIPVHAEPRRDQGAAGDAGRKSFEVARAMTRPFLPTPQ